MPDNDKLDTKVVGDLEAFGSTPSVLGKWNAARRLMAARSLNAVIDKSNFVDGISALETFGREGTDIDRLLSVGLLVRLNNSLQGNPALQYAINTATQVKLPPLSSLAEVSDQIAHLKPAELRENVAQSLSFVDAPWALDYAIENFVEEDRSLNCMTELCRQIARRNPNVTWWHAQTNQELANKSRPNQQGEKRLQDICAVMARVVRDMRRTLSVDEATGVELAKLCSKLVPFDKNRAPRKGHENAASEVAGLVDEMFYVNLALLGEPKAYAVLPIIQRWWAPLPLPDSVREGFRPVIEKLVDAIRMLARADRRSEGLVDRLRQFLGYRAASELLLGIANEEVGLSEDVDRWLRGREIPRPTDASSAAADDLKRVREFEAVRELAPLIREAHQISTAVSSNGNEADVLSRIQVGLLAFASRRGIQVIGEPGDVVEYSGAAHETVDGTQPPEPKVTVVHPMVVLRRKDGSTDILLKALVRAV